MSYNSKTRSKNLDNLSGGQLVAAIIGLMILIVILVALGIIIGAGVSLLVWNVLGMHAAFHLTTMSFTQALWIGAIWSLVSGSRQVVKSDG